ncbi:MAG TPA: hypothetical protein VFJ16_24570 [Longimicrobium sp.]|nr:hypothetical protein [Longimicrobium sp.]
METSARLSVLAVVAAAVLLGACDHAERENRNALAPLVQRYQRLGEDFTQWAQTEDEGQVSWGDVLGQYEHFIGEHQKLHSDLRAVVTTPKYACLTGLLGRGAEADIAYLRARRSVFQHQLSSRNSMNHATQSLEQVSESYYGGQAYLESARRDLESARHADEQADTFRRVSNRRAATALALSDSIAFAARELQIIPQVDTVRELALFPDSVGAADRKSARVSAIRAVCVDTVPAVKPAPKPAPTSGPASAAARA